VQRLAAPADTQDGLIKKEHLAGKATAYSAIAGLPEVWNEMLNEVLKEEEDG